MTGEPPTNGDRNDPARWGHSLANLQELVLGCLDAVGARSVAEVGAYAGDLTRVLLEWASGPGAQVVAIEPAPHPDLRALAAGHPELELVEKTSHDALGHIEIPDAVIIDSDHNYYTASEELRLIGERAPGADTPLLIFHDVGWPNARRDSYWHPERVPEDQRQPLARMPTLFPGEPGLADEGLVVLTSAAMEGGSRNGVLTAIEDFLEGRPDLRLATVPAFFGLGVVWRADAAWARELLGVLEPWDRNPVLGRLEENRLFHLATSHGRSVRLDEAEAELAKQREANATLGREVERLRARSAGQERVLGALLDSGALRIADRLSGLRHPGRDWSWHRRLRRVLGRDGDRR